MLFGCSELPKINARIQCAAGETRFDLVLASPRPACWFFWGRRRLYAGETSGYIKAGGREIHQSQPRLARIIGQFIPIVIARVCRATMQKGPALARPGLLYLVAGTGFEPVTFGL